MRTAIRFTVILAVLTGLVLLAAVVFPRAFIHFYGIDTQQSDNYDFWSGPAGPFITLLGFTTLITGAWHRLNCHTDGCWRIGRFHVAGGQFLVCGKHHTAVTGHPSRLTVDVLKMCHLQHLEKHHGP